jgi:regulator of sirC expression with transglutaminase-like and TPR domain
MSEISTLSALGKFAKSGGSALDGALIVSQIIDPATDVRSCRRKIEELAAALPAGAGAADINALLQARGFRGPRDYYKSENSALGHVLSTGEGIPISLSIVIMGICDAIDLPANGINFPGHFLVSVADELIDPVSLALISQDQCQQWLRSNNLDPASALRVASATDIALRMLNNLSNLAQANNDHAKVLELSDHKLVVAGPQLLTVYLERVACWQALGVNKMARHDLQAAIEQADDAQLQAALRSRLADMADASSSLH